MDINDDNYKYTNTDEVIYNTNVINNIILNQIKIEFNCISNLLIFKSSFTINIINRKVEIPDGTEEDNTTKELTIIVIIEFNIYLGEDSTSESSIMLLFENESCGQNFQVLDKTLKNYIYYYALELITKLLNSNSIQNKIKTVLPSSSDEPLLKKRPIKWFLNLLKKSFVLLTNMQQIKTFHNQMQELEHTRPECTTAFIFETLNTFNITIKVNRPHIDMSPTYENGPFNFYVVDDFNVGFSKFQGIANIIQYDSGNTMYEQLKDICKSIKECIKLLFVEH